MNIFLKSGMSLNLATSQVFLTQDISQDTSLVEMPVEETTPVEATDTTGTEGDMSLNAGETGNDGAMGDIAVDGAEITDGETSTEGIDSETGLEGEVSVDEAVEGSEGESIEGDMGVDGGYTEDYYGMNTDMMGDMYGMTGAEGAEVKDPLLSNWYFVIGISVATLVVGVVLGILLAKKRIKKGIELYEN